MDYDEVKSLGSTKIGQSGQEKFTGDRSYIDQTLCGHKIKLEIRYISLFTFFRFARSRTVSDTGAYLYFCGHVTLQGDVTLKYAIFLKFEQIKWRCIANYKLGSVSFHLLRFRSFKF